MEAGGAARARRRGGGALKGGGAGGSVRSSPLVKVRRLKRFKRLDVLQASETPASRFVPTDPPRPKRHRRMSVVKLRVPIGESELVMAVASRAGSRGMLKTAARCGALVTIFAATYSLARPLCPSSVLSFASSARDLALSPFSASVVQRWQLEARMLKRIFAGRRMAPVSGAVSPATTLAPGIGKIQSGQFASLQLRRAAGSQGPAQESVMRLKGGKKAQPAVGRVVLDKYTHEIKSKNMDKPGFAKVEVTKDASTGKLECFLETDMAGLWIHWGFAKRDSGWFAPPAQYIPDGSKKVPLPPSFSFLA